MDDTTSAPPRTSQKAPSDQGLPVLGTVLTASIRWVRNFVLLPLALAGIAYLSVVAGVFLIDQTRVARMTCFAQGGTLREFLRDYEEASTAAQNFINAKSDTGTEHYEDLMKNIAKSGGQVVFFEDTPVIRDYRKAHLFFENLGVLVRSGTVDYQLVFDLIAFPDTFWVESMDLRNKLSANWNPSTGQLSDFAEGMAYLKWRYENSRSKSKKRTSAPWMDNVAN